MSTTRFDGAGLAGHDSEYVVETHLRIEPADIAGDLPAGLWDSLLTSDDKFTFALVAPMSENTAEAALEQWGTRLDVLEASVERFDRDETFAIDLTLITCETFPAAWLTALTAKFPVKVSGNYATDAEPDDDELPDDDDSVIVGGVNPYTRA